MAEGLRFCRGLIPEHTGVLIAGQRLFELCVSCCPTPQDPQTLAELSRSIPTWLSDYGTEVGFASVKPIRVKDLLPYFVGEAGVTAEEEEDVVGNRGEPEVDFAEEDEPAPPARERQTEVDFADEAGGGRQPEQDPRIDVTASLEVPGLLHIISNAGITLGSAMDYYSEAINKLTKVANILTSKGSKDRLFETCFSHSGAGRELFRHIWPFRNKCHLERWGTVSTCISAVLGDVETSIRWGWDLQRYENGSQHHPQMDRDSACPESHRSRMDIVDEAVRDPFWWGYLHMLNKIAGTLNIMLRWSESCSCHWDLLRADEEHAAAGEVGDAPLLSDAVRADIAECPLRGRRCADLAGGEFMQLLNGLCQERVAQLLTNELQCGMTQAQRQRIINDFERGRVHLITYLTMKLSQYDHPPFCIFGLAHKDCQVRKRCYDKIVNSDNPHPVVAQMRANPLAREGELFMDYDATFPPELATMPRLRSLVAQYRMALCAERCQEAPHARTKREVWRCPNHTEALVSQAHRLPYLESYLALGTDEFQEIAATLATVTHGRKACELLGIGGHPSSCSRKDKARHRMHWKVIYHNDPFSKYAAEAPPVDRHRPQDWPGADAFQAGLSDRSAKRDEPRASDQPGPSQPGVQGDHSSVAPVAQGVSDGPCSREDVPLDEGENLTRPAHVGSDDEEEVRRLAYLQHLLAFFTENPDTIFSMPFVENTVMSLKKVLGVKHHSEETDRLLFSGHELGVGGPG